MKLTKSSSASSSTSQDTQKLTELPLCGINFRDLADADKATIQSQKVYRGSEMFRAEYLGQLGIKTVIDMRKQAKEDTNPFYVELSSADKSVHVAEDVRVVKLDVIKPQVKMKVLSKMPKKIWWDLAKCLCKRGKPEQLMCPAVADPEILGYKEFYKILVDKAGDVLAEVLRVFADETAFPILVHCTHGKDRTGIVCCLLELIAGCPSKAIIDDYTLSEEQIKAARPVYKLPIPDYLLADYVIEACPDYIQGLMEHIESRYGGIDGYLRSIGVTREEQLAIKRNIAVM